MKADSVPETGPAEIDMAETAKAETPWDADAVEQLVADHQGSVRAYLRYLGCPSALVDDLAQETFLTLLSARFEIRGDRAASRYLRTIARHLFLKSLRRLDRSAPSFDVDAAESLWARRHGQADGSRYMDALEICLETISGRAKTVLELRYSTGLGRAATAEKLELTESGVHSILVRVRRKLRECVQGRVDA